MNGAKLGQVVVCLGYVVDLWGKKLWIGGAWLI